MNEYKQFHQWLFPGDPLVGAANPLPADATHEDILTEVYQQTGVPTEWLYKAGEAVLEGLAGLGCLWYLHGASGVIEEQSMGRQPVDSRARQELRDLAGEATKNLVAKLRKQHPAANGGYFGVDWGKGTIVEVSCLDSPFHPFLGVGQQAEAVCSVFGSKSRRKTLRLGKFLRKHGASASLRKAFEERQLRKWEWKVSCHPYDVLTMSFRRGWTSCMRPPDPERGKIAGLAPHGSLTDMAAGSALLFYYRPGATEPCARRIVRPGIDSDGSPYILDGGYTYGSCEVPKISAAGLGDLFGDATGIKLPVKRAHLCDVGDSGRALSRYIYSDIDHAFCSQAPEEYEEAYDELGSADWPSPKLKMTSMVSAVTRVEKQVDWLPDSTQDERPCDPHELAQGVVEYHANDSLIEIADALGDVTTLDEWVTEYLGGVRMLILAEEAENDVCTECRELFIEVVQERVENNGRTLVLAFAEPSVQVESALRDIERYYVATCMPPEFTFSDAIQALGIETDDMIEWTLPDGEVVDRVLLIPADFKDALKLILLQVALARAVIDDFDWTDEIEHNSF